MFLLHISQKSSIFAAEFAKVHENGAVTDYT